MGQASGRLTRVVLDTNVVLSALLFLGPTSRLAMLWRELRFQWLASAAIVQEYTRVLAYPKFQLQDNEIRSILHDDVLPYVMAVHVPTVPPVILQDPSDDIFLACALRGKARYLVSGDRHLLNLKIYKGISIVSVKDFLALFSETP